jgi:hypothetical protein
MTTVYNYKAVNTSKLTSTRNLFKRIYDIHPQNYEQLVSISGVGPATVRALSLIGEIIYGSKASWQDPVKYNFAHGGKDGVPYPVARKIYDNSIRYLGAGASIPFRLPTMKDLVKRFEKKLEKSKPNPTTKEYEVMVPLYRSV